MKKWPWFLGEGGVGLYSINGFPSLNVSGGNVNHDVGVDTEGGLTLEWAVWKL